MRLRHIIGGHITGSASEELGHRSRITPRRAELKEHGCGVCHVIPGVPGARGQVGPPLTDFRRHVYVAGKFPNVPETLISWIQDAPAMAPETAMLALGVTAADARDMAAYLYTLR